MEFCFWLQNFFQDKITDIHIICGVLKDFLRKIEEPIITFALHENFMNAAGK